MQAPTPSRSASAPLDLHHPHRCRCRRAPASAVMACAEGRQGYSHHRGWWNQGLRRSGQGIGGRRFCAMVGRSLPAPTRAPRGYLYQGGHTNPIAAWARSAPWRGSADRYFQQEVNDTMKLVLEGIEGQVPYKARLAAFSTSLRADCVPPWGIPGRKTSKPSAAKQLSSGFRALRSTSHVHGVTITRESPNYGGAAR